MLEKRSGKLRMVALHALALTMRPACGFSFTRNARRMINRYSNDGARLRMTTLSSSTDAVELQTTDFSKHSVDDDTPPVLLLHGLLGSKRNFSTIGASLSSQLQQKRRILGVDLRNHGENTHDWRSDMSYVSMAQDVLRVLDHENLSKAVLVGHSMGGKVAQALSLLHPERVDGLVVLDIAPVEYSKEEPHWEAVHGIIDALTKVPEGLERRDVDKELRATVPDPALRAFLLTNYHEGKWSIPVKILQAELDTLAGFDIPSSTYDGDVFFIHGGQSRFVRHGHMETIASYFPNHMLTTVKGAGHWVHAEAPDATVALLKQYLDRNVDARTSRFV